MVEVNLYNYNGFDFNSNKIEFNGTKFNLPENFNVANESENTISLYDKSDNITINMTHLNDNISIKTYFQHIVKQIIPIQHSYFLKKTTQIIVCGY